MKIFVLAMASEPIVQILIVGFILSFVYAYFEDKKKPVSVPPKKIESAQDELYRKGHEYLVGDHW